MRAPAWRTFVARRVARRNMALLMVAAGLLACVAAVGIRFRASLWVLLGGGGSIFVLGLALLAGAYGPPVREIILLARERGTALTPADLVGEMGLELEDARSILQALCRRGVLRRADNAEAYLLAGHLPAPPLK